MTQVIDDPKAVFLANHLAAELAGAVVKMCAELSKKLPREMKDEEIDNIAMNLMVHTLMMMARNFTDGDEQYNAVRMQLIDSIKMMGPEIFNGDTAEH